MTKLERLAQWLRPRVPFTVLNTVWRNLDKSAITIIDLGCGRGIPMRYINRNGQFRVTAVDVHEPWLDEAWATGAYSECILHDLRTLPTNKMEYDVALCLDVLEHSAKEESVELLKKMEKMAQKQVIVSMPVGKYVQHPAEGNPFQEHKCQWIPEEMRALGYRVRGVGMKGIGSDTGLSADAPRSVMPFFYFLYVLAGLFVYYFPKYAEEMVCIKNLEVE